MNEFFLDIQKLSGIEHLSGVEILSPDKSRFSVNIFGKEWYNFRFVQALDLSYFPQGTIAKAGELDIRNTSQFSFTNRGVVEQLRDKRYVQTLIEESAKGVSRRTPFLTDVLQTGRLAPIERKDIVGDRLYHCGGTTYTREQWNLGRSPIDKVAAMERTGVYGPTNRVTYVTNEFNRAFAHSPRSDGSDVMLLILSVDRLFALRNLFVDPESLTMSSEFMKNFVIPLGIPVSAIQSAYHLQCEGRLEK